MRIGQLARLVEIDTQTIRFYEQQGLLPSVGRRENGYRVYTKKHGQRLRFIRRCRILGLSLAEISELQQHQDEPHQPCNAVNVLLDDHISHLQSQIATLQAREIKLVSLRDSCKDGRERAEWGVLYGLKDNETPNG